MKISGFTICRNAIKYDFPVVESIHSILPIVDEFIVNVGESEDETEKLIQSINSPKIRIVRSVWDELMNKDGLIFSVQTNIALRECTGDWAIYLQSDEVIHEKDLPMLRTLMEENVSNPNALGMSFRYNHFYGDYYTVNPWGYHWAVRIIKNNGKLENCGDGVGFCVKETGEFLSPKGKTCIRTGAHMYHYSFVRDPKVLIAKRRFQASRHHGDAIPEKEALELSKDQYEFEAYEICKEFRGTHPKVMKDRFMKNVRLKPRINRWFNLRFYKEILAHGPRGL